MVWYVVRRIAAKGATVADKEEELFRAVKINPLIVN